MTTSIQKYMVISIGYEQLIGVSGFDGLKRVIDELKQYNMYSILETCSKISITLLHWGTANSLGQAHLLAGLVPEKSLRMKYYNKSKAVAAGLPWAIFHHQSVLTLVKLALTHCSIDKGKKITPDNINELTTWLLILNDECYLEETGRGVVLPTKEHERERLRAALARYQFFLASERLGYKMGRYRWIIDYFREHKPHGQDIDKLFMEATGVGLSEFMAVCGGLIVKWVRISTKKPDIIKDWVTCKDAYFAKTKINKKMLNKVFDLIAMEPSEFHDLYEKAIKDVLGGDEKIHYNFLPLVWKPLIWGKDKKCFVCPSAEYLFDRVTESLYREIETYLWRGDKIKKRQTFSIAWGKAFEQYINTALSEAFGKSFCSNPLDVKTGDEMVDGVTENKNYIFIFETKSVHWSYKAMVTGYQKNMMPTLKQLFANKGLSQIGKCIQRVKSGDWKLPFSIKGRQFIPILIVPDYLPHDALNRRLYERVAADAKSISLDRDVLPFIILTAEEVEIIEAIAIERGKDIVLNIIVEYCRVYTNRNADGFVVEAISFKNYLHYRGYEKQDNLTNNKRLLTYFDDVMNEVCLEAFGSKLEKRKVVN